MVFNFPLSSRMDLCISNTITLQQSRCLRSIEKSSRLQRICGIQASLMILKVLLNSLSNSSPTPIGATDIFSNSQCDICATKSNLKVDSAVSDAGDKSNGKKSEKCRPKSSGNKNEEYQSKPRKEKKKKNRK